MDFSSCARRGCDHLSQGLNEKEVVEKVMSGMKLPRDDSLP